MTAVEGLDVDVRSEFLAAKLILERPEHLPGVARSAEVAYIFSETVEFLGEQIRRSRVFVASYKQRLNLLALAVAKCLKRYRVDEGSFFVSSLVESEPEWRRIPNGEIEVIELLLKKLPAEVGWGSTNFRVRHRCGKHFYCNRPSYINQLHRHSAARVLRYFCRLH